MERAVQPFLVSPQWEPHTPTLRFGVFASKWPKSAEAVWTMVNRNAYSLSGAEIEVPYRAGERFYDLWHGVELQPLVRGARATLSFDLDANGYGALLATTELSPTLQALMRTSRAWAAKPLSTYSSEWKSLPQTIVPIAKTELAQGPVDGMVLLAKTSFRFRVIGIEIEGKNDDGVDVQYSWEPSARRYHDAVEALDSLWIDKYPVTNLQFKAFTEATHYRPADHHNFCELGLRESVDSWAANNIVFSAKGEVPLHIDRRHPCDCALEANLYYNSGEYTAPPEDTKTFALAFWVAGLSWTTAIL